MVMEPPVSNTRWVKYLKRIDRPSSALGEFWGWVAEYFDDGRVSFIMFNARYHFDTDEYSFRCRINGRPHWYVIESPVDGLRVRDLRTLYREAMTIRRYDDLFTEVLQTQSGKTPHIGSGV